MCTFGCPSSRALTIWTRLGGRTYFALLSSYFGKLSNDFIIINIENYVPSEQFMDALMRVVDTSVENPKRKV
jgi:hypothetical protein